jgi:hypothetical protein
MAEKTKAELEKDLAEVTTERDQLALQLEEAEKALTELKAAPVAEESPAYALIQLNANNPLFIFDGLRHEPRKGFYLHEKHELQHDSGYANYLQDRAIDTVKRAFMPERMGANYSNLPNFQRTNELHVIVVVKERTDDNSPLWV